MLNKTTSILVRIACIILVVSLCLAVYFNGKNISCDKCVIRFKQTEKLGAMVEWNEEVKVMDLNLNLSKGICLISWDNKNGYMSKLNKINLTQYEQ